jgi:pSer/pThr/pTyr-binding forkhead associated (FHA) protein
VSVWHGLLERLTADPEPVRLQPPAMHAGERRVIGRSSTCDYAVADPTVSTRHAELVRLDDGWLIRDLGSLNGTRVNGWLANEERLRCGDTVTLGATTFVFRPYE